MTPGRRHKGDPHVKNLRKRNNKHEYLVKWQNNEEEWIDRNTMITKHPQNVIAFFEQILSFKPKN